MRALLLLNPSCPPFEKGRSKKEISIIPNSGHIIPPSLPQMMSEVIRFEARGLRDTGFPFSRE
jgi:hypothetical protein